MRFSSPQAQKYVVLFVLGCTVLLGTQSIDAKELGVIGTPYPFAETDFITMAQRKLQEKFGKDGGIHRWQIQQQESMRVAADRPAPVEGLRPTIHPRRWLWDPSFVIPYDVRSANGSIVLKAGSRFNPLDTVSLKNALIFFNGDDPAQLSWAQEHNKAFKGRVLLILVNGSLREVQSYFPKKHVYFDQEGRLTQQLQITQIPAVVRQVGKQLEVNEVKV